MTFRQTEFSHVKTNLVHQLYQVRKFGSMPLSYFSELLSPEEMERCRNSVKRGWTNLQQDVFTSLMFRVIFLLSLLYCIFCSRECVHFSIKICTSNILFFGTLFQQDIAAAGDLAVLVYREETKPEDVTREGIAAAMKMGIKERTSKLIVKLGKMTAVANPAHGPEFLQEVYINSFLSF